MAGSVEPGGVGAWGAGLCPGSAARRAGWGVQVCVWGVGGGKRRGCAWMGWEGGCRRDVCVIMCGGGGGGGAGGVCVGGGGGGRGGGPGGPGSSCRSWPRTLIRPLPTAKRSPPPRTTPPPPQQMEEGGRRERDWIDTHTNNRHPRRPMFIEPRPSHAPIRVPQPLRDFVFLHVNLNMVMPSGRRTLEGGACSSDMVSRQFVAAPQETPAGAEAKLQMPRQKTGQKLKQEPSQPDRKPASDNPNQKMSRKMHSREQDGANENVQRQHLPVHQQGSARAGVGGGAGRGRPDKCSNQQRQKSGIHQTTPSVGIFLGKIHQFKTIAGKNGRYPML